MKDHSPRTLRPERGSNSRRSSSTRNSSVSRQRNSSTRRSSSTARRRGSSGKNRNLYRKSRYYQKQRQKYILFGAGILILLLLILTFSIRSCVKSSQKATEASNVSSNDPASIDGKSIASNSESQENIDAEITPTPAFAPVDLTVSVVGDCTLGTDAYFDYNTSLNSYYDSYGAEYFLQNVKSIFSADDLTIANFEGVLTDLDTREDKQFAFKAPASFADILTAGSVEAVNTANNHSHDYGEQGFTDTLHALDDRNIVHFGYDETAVMEIKGIKVGLVGIYELNDHLGCEQQLKDNIAKVKSEGAQLVIVIFHWGNEKETVPDSNQTTLGRLAIDEGADLVCGHHPHVLQGMESYKGKNIVYSLGNFCFGGNSYPSDMDTIIYQQTFTITAEGVSTASNVNIIPCSISSEYGYNNYQPTPSEGDEATRILQKFEERTSWIQPAQ